MNGARDDDASEERSRTSLEASLATAERALERMRLERNEERRRTRSLAKALSDLPAGDAPHEAGLLDPADFGGDHRALAEAVNVVFARRGAEQKAMQGFVNDAAHQLRTPLAVLSARLDAPGEVDVENAKRDIAWMGRLVEQLLSSARASNASPEAMQPLNVGELALDIVASLAPLAIFRGRELELEVEADADVDPEAASGDEEGLSAFIVRADFGLVFEALSNLVENALGHAPEGSVVTVRVEPAKKAVGASPVGSEAGAVVRVMDRGSGVPESERERIFGRFSQGSSPTKGGAGLGLAIVSDVMHRHGGRVTYDDREAGGAVFSLAFPTYDAAPETIAPPAGGEG